MEDHPKEKAPKEEPKAREEPKAWEEPKGKDPKVKEDAQGPPEAKKEVLGTEEAQGIRMLPSQEAPTLHQEKTKTLIQRQEVRIPQFQK